MPLRPRRAAAAPPSHSEGLCAPPPDAPDPRPAAPAEQPPKQPRPQIETDRRLLLAHPFISDQPAAPADKKKNLSLCNTDSAPNTPFSYIPLLQQPRTRQKKHISLHRLSTLNILCFLDESFRLSDRHVLRLLPNIRPLLQAREDLFPALLAFLGTAARRNTLFYWAPGFSDNNLYSFLHSVSPDFAQHYHGYFIKSKITGVEAVECAEFLRESDRAMAERIDGLRRDWAVLGGEVVVSGGAAGRGSGEGAHEMHELAEMHEMHEICQYLITEEFWCAGAGRVSEKRAEVYRSLGVPVERGSENTGDIAGALAETVSWAEVEIGGRAGMARLDRLAQFLLGEIGEEGVFEGGSLGNAGISEKSEKSDKAELKVSGDADESQ